MNKKRYEYWLKRNWYYHDYMAKFYQFVIPQHMKVLQVGCKNGFLLNAVNPCFAVGIDSELEYINEAQEKYPEYQFFCTNIEEFGLEETFDYIIISSTVMEVYDIQSLFEHVQRFCTSGTRIVIDSYSHLWEPILWLLQKWGMRRPTELKNWISKADLKSFLELAHFDTVTDGNQLLFPVYIPFISSWLNAWIALVPFINNLCLNQWVIARPKTGLQPQRPLRVSIVIPCKNERGNIEDAVLRCPAMGEWTELLFVDGHSQDGTLAEIQRVAEKYPEKRIRYYVQPNSGKGDAVRFGFDKAEGDILMIQDADLTAPPEELPKFFNALVNGHGEFINGSRLIYGMEDKAMRFLNLIANYLFGVGFSWLLGQRIKDTLCGTKVIYKQDYKRIQQNRDYFGDFDPFGDFDLLFGAAKQNLKIVDMPVHYKARTYGTSQIRRFHAGMLLVRMFLVAFKKFKLSKHQSYGRLFFLKKASKTFTYCYSMINKK